MVVRTFTFTSFLPRLWDAPHIPPEEAGGEIVLDVEGNAPPSSNRSLLKTTVRALPSPNSSFNAYVVRHDVVVRVRDAYPTAASDSDPDSDELEDLHLTRPRNYSAFELRDTPGQVYTTMPLPQINQMLNRVQESRGLSGVLLEPREVNLHDLENALKSDGTINVVIHGYDLKDVLWSTPVSRLDIDANQTTENQEAQHAKSRAANMRVLKLYVQVPNQMVSARVGANGSVKFPNYPGDDKAMYVLEILEPIIATCLQTA